MSYIYSSDTASSPARYTWRRQLLTRPCSPGRPTLRSEAAFHPSRLALVGRIRSYWLPTALRSPFPSWPNCLFSNRATSEASASESRGLERPRISLLGLPLRGGTWFPSKTLRSSSSEGNRRLLQP